MRELVHDPDGDGDEQECLETVAARSFLLLWLLPDDCLSMVGWFSFVRGIRIKEISVTVSQCVVDLYTDHYVVLEVLSLQHS